MAEKTKRAPTEADGDGTNTKKAKSDSGIHMHEKTKGGDRLLALVKRSYVAPLTDEQLSGNSMRVFTIGVMESVHTTMTKMMQEYVSLDDITSRAFAIVDAKIDEMTTVENQVSMKVLKELIAAERLGTTDDVFGMQPQEIMGIKVGLTLAPPSEIQTCVFKILRKAMALGEKPVVIDRKRRMEEDKRNLLVPRAVMLGKATMQRTLLEQELAVLTEKQTELLKKRRYTNEKIDEMGMAIEKMKETLDETWGKLSENIPEDGGDGERSSLASIKKSMVHSATYALSEATSTLRRELAETEDFLSRLETEIANKQSQLGVELQIEGVLSEDEIRDAIQMLYDKSDGLQHIAKITRNIQELMSLPDVVRQAWTLIFNDTRASFDMLMGVPPPPLPPS